MHPTQQIWTTLKISLLSLPQRLWMSMSSILGISLVILVLLGALTLENSFRQVLRDVGAADVVIVRQEGTTSELYSAITAEQQQLVAAAPGVSLGTDGLPLVSRELYMVVDGIQRGSGESGNLLLRGVDAAAFRIHEDVRLVAGRSFSPGSNEMIVGRRVAENYEGYALGASVQIGNAEWIVVGTMESGGNAFESEVWVNAPVLQAVYKQDNNVQIMRLKLDGRDAIFLLRSYFLNDPRLPLSVIPERVYYANQSATAVAMIRVIGIPLTLIMAFGAVAAAMNTMSASVSSRAKEITVLRMVGFQRRLVFLGILLESVLLCLVGGMVGAVIALVSFVGMEASTLGESFTQVMFDLSLTGGQVAIAIACAMTIGIVGGLIPAARISEHKR